MKYIYILLLLTLIFHKPFTEENHKNDFNKNNTNDPTDDLSDIVMEGNDLIIFGSNENSQDIKTIKKEEIEKLNPADLKTLLQDAFHLNAKSYGTYGNESTITIRGFSGSRILILIDGVSINSKQSGQIDLSLIPVSNIEEIQLIKGGSDTKYNLSGAIGGVINIITKKNNKAGFKIFSSIYNLFYYPNFYYIGYGENKKKYFSKIYDFFDTQKLNLGFRIGNNIVYWDLYAEGNRAFNHFIYKDNDDISRRTVDNEIWDASASSSLKFNLPLYMKLYFSGSYFYANKNIPGPMTSTTPGKQIDHLATATIFYDADFVGHEKIDTEFIVNYKYHNLQWYDPETNNSHNLYTLNTINRWGFLVTGWLTIRTGGDFTYNYLDSNHIGKIHLLDGGFFLTAEFSILSISKIIPSNKLLLTNNYPIPIPKLGLVFYIGKYFILKNNFYRTYRLPSINDLYWPKDSMGEGNPDLNPEDGIGGDIILEFNYPGILSAETSVYINYLKDAIQWQPDSGGVWKPKNIGEAFYFGIDNEIKSDFSKYVTLTTSYSFLLTYVLTEEYNFEDDKRIPYRPMHTLGLGISINWKNGNINLIGHYESERFIAVNNITKLNQFFKLDINFSQTIKIVTIFASIKNTFNYLYFLSDQYPMPGGSITLGVKINYEKKFKNKTSNDIKE